MGKLSLDNIILPKSYYFIIASKSIKLRYLNTCKLKLQDESDEENTWEYWNENDEATVPDFLKIDEGFEVSA